VGRPVVLKNLLREKHWQTYRTFCAQYDKAARTIDPGLVGSNPSRAQLHRWQSGDLKNLPYPHHCQVLEAMFPGVTAAQMFAPAEGNGELGAVPTTEPLAESELLASIRDGLDAPDAPRLSWCKDGLGNSSRSAAPPLAFPLTVGQNTTRPGTDDDIA
jgi:hypothetical protein